jgi:hypothetical protein
VEKMIVCRSYDVNVDTFHGAKVGHWTDEHGRLHVEVFADEQSDNVAITAEYNEWKSYTWYTEEESNVRMEVI